MKNSGKSVLSNFIWRLLERVGAQLVSLIVSVVLARLLSPSDYGTVALMNVFVNILMTFIEAGFSVALVQKKDADDVDFSSVFYVQMIICLASFIILFFTAPIISGFYDKPEMIPMIRVLSLTLIVSGIKNIQISYVSRNMIFKKFFYATLGGTIGAAFIGIALAYAGFGAWALIIQSLFNNTVDTIILWIIVKWRPKKMFSFARVKKLFSYSSKILAASMLYNVYNNLRSLVIGKKYSSEDLAYYDQGNRWPYMIVNNINSSIDSVLLPSMSAAQEDKYRLKQMTRRAIKTSTYIMAPLMMGMAFCGEPLFTLILTEKWLPAVPFLVIFCIAYMFQPIHTANLNAIKAMGRSDLFFKLELIKDLFGIILLIITVRISVLAVGYAAIIASVFGQIVNSWPNKKLLNYGYCEQLKDILPGILLAVFMGFCVFWVKFLPIPEIIILIIQFIVGACIYWIGSVLLKLESYHYILGLLRQYFVSSKRKQIM